MKFSGHHQGFIFSSILSCSAIFWGSGPKENWTVELMSFTELNNIFLMRQFSAVALCSVKMIMMAFGWNLWLNTHHWWTEFVSWVLNSQSITRKNLKQWVVSQTENLCCFVFQSLEWCYVCLAIMLANGVLYVKIYPNHRISRKILLAGSTWKMTLNGY